MENRADLPGGIAFFDENDGDTTLRDTILPLSIDRTEVFKIKRRFLNINRARWQWVYEQLPAHQKLFFDLLALLFHTNHPLMPGYGHKDYPSGVSDYSPGKRALAQALRVARSFA